MISQGAGLLFDEARKRVGLIFEQLFLLFRRGLFGIHDRAVIAQKRLAIDQKIAAAVTADVSESDQRIGR